MENSNISPVTESEVMDFAQRVCTAIVSHSKQAEAIANLQNDLTQTINERDYLRGENSRLNTSIGESNSLADAYAKERDAAHTELGATRSSLEFLRDTMVIRDAKVSELGQEVNQLKAEAEKWEREAHSHSDDADKLTIMLNASRDQLDSWIARATSAETERDKAKADLNKLQDTFKTVFGHMQDAAPKLESEKPVPETPVYLEELDKPSYQNVPITEGPTETKPDKLAHPDESPF